jgi:nucleotide-binding universal stress UspA family protein
MRMMLGSVAEAVVRTAGRPVLTLPPSPTSSGEIEAR